MVTSWVALIAANNRSAIGTDDGSMLTSPGIGLRQAVVLYTSAIPFSYSIGWCQFLQPVRRYHRKLVQRRTQGFADTFQPVEFAHISQHVRRVGTLSSTGLDQIPFSQVTQKRVEQESFSVALQSNASGTRSEPYDETGIGQRQAECILPVYPSPHRVGGLPIGQASPRTKGKHGSQGEPTRCFGRLAAAREQLDELAILVDRAECVCDKQVGRGVGERRTRDAAGLLGYRRRIVRVQRHWSALPAGESHLKPLDSGLGACPARR